jgi:hypothetical protein
MTPIEIGRKLFSECAVTIGRSGPVVSIDCDDANDADAVFAFLESLAGPDEAQKKADESAARHDNIGVEIVGEQL